MIKFEEFSQKLIQENSLYKTPAERDDFIKDRTRMLDTFYINFFTFIGLFSINVLAPLKKYEQTEGKLLVDNIGDANHDVSLIIKLLYDQKVLSRSVVDNMTKLLVKIKTKQLASADIKEDVIRKLLTDMQYTSHRGTAPVMSVIEDFASGKIQLKHLAYQLYNLAKKKNYSSITSEIRAVGVYYSAWFKKVGADVVPAATQATTVPAVVQSSPAQLPTPASLVLGTPAQSTPAPQAPATKTKDAEFWNRLFNARGKVEFTKLFKEYKLDAEPTLTELTNAAQTAADFGAINFGNLQKSYAAQLVGSITSSAFYAPYITLVRTAVLKAETLIDVGMLLTEISATQSAKVISDIIRNKIGISKLGSKLNTHVVKLTKEFAAALTNTTFDANSQVRRDLADCLQTAFWRINFGDTFTLEEQLKLLSVFGPTVISSTNIKKSLESLLGMTLNTYDSTPIDKEVWESKIDANLRKTFADLNMLTKLGIYITSTNDFSEKLANVNDVNDLLTFIKSSVMPILDKNNTKTLDVRYSTQLLDRIFEIQDKLIDSSSYVYVSIKDIISPAVRYAGGDWGYYFWNTCVDRGIVLVKSSEMSLEDFIKNIVAEAETTGKIQSDLYTKLRQLEPQLLEYALPYVSSPRSMQYYVSKYAQRIASDNFINLLINKNIANSMQRWTHYSFESVGAASQKITQESAKKLFVVLSDNNWGPLYIKGLIQLPYRLANREEFGQWLSDFITANPPPVSTRDEVITMCVGSFSTFVPNKADLVRIYDVNKMTRNLSTVNENAALRQHYIDTFVSTAQTAPSQSAHMLYSAARHNESFASDMLANDFTPEQFDGIVATLNELLGVNGNTYGMVKDKHGFGLKTATAAIGTLGAKLFQTVNGEATVEKLAEILAKQTNIAKEYRESVITDIASLFVNADITPDTERAFSKFETRTQKILAAEFATSQFAQGAVDEINNNAIIKPRSALPPKGALKVLKLNRVTIPSTVIIDMRKTRGASPSLQDIRDAALDVAKKFKLENQAIVEQPQSPIELEKLSVVYNRYNRYKHGGIAVKIRKVFNVNIGVQQLGWAEYLKEITDKTTYYYRIPQFHGTASLPASMILRYGFSIIDEKLAREAGIKYAGRMLGDGIYSSNVLDKVSQYINDDAPTGVSRRRGVVGYIFEMETQGNTWGRSCDSPGADFSTGGTGEFPNERGGLVSPEWAWKGANSQCRIKRCYEIELINRDEMDELVKKHSDVNEAIAATGFKEFLLAEAIAKNGVDNWTSFTFMDNTVPVGNGKFINVDDEPVANLQRVLPRDAVVDFGMHGVTVMFKTDDNAHTRLLYGSDIMSNYEVRSLYSKCLGRKV